MTFGWSKLEKPGLQVKCTGFGTTPISKGKPLDEGQNCRSTDRVM